MRNPRFLELLVSSGIVSDEVAGRLATKYREDSFEVLMHLVRGNAASRNTLGRLWGDSIDVSYVDMRTTLFQREIVGLLPERFARTNHMILLYQFGNAITAATSEPLKQFTISEAERIVGRPISTVFCFPQDIEDAIEIEYQSEASLRDLSNKIVTDTILIEDISELTRDALQQIAGSQAVVQFAQGLLLLAVREGASDVHVEPEEDKVRVRFRIDGVLRDKSKLEKSLLAPLVSRLKILGNLDIAEKRRPQDGRIMLKLPNRTIDFRISCIPTINGEKIVLRLLGQGLARDVPDMTDLALSRSILDQLKRILDNPYGILFVTGPTGSGKTTTLFSMLKYLNRPGINITTIEDPVEYQLPGVNQVQINPGVGLDFSTALRAYLRQDPDVILVGEVRDVETAENACRAALTGHLVLATLHTNNAAQAVTRLTDMGVQPFIVAPAVVGVMAQRLVRKLCENCREPYPASDRHGNPLVSPDGREIVFYRPKGCTQCNQSGYAGRIAIHEVISINDEIRKLMAQSASLSEIQECARQHGFHPMRYDGLKKVVRGLTSLAEIDRVTPADENASV
ncbi:MAG: GspE/PulE family protein [Methylotetracoccus sp.]